MSQHLGRVAALWRYPVKSLRGEPLAEAFVGFAGLYGDRIYAFGDASEPPGFPYLTGRRQPRMLLYRPHFRDAALAAEPPNRAAAEQLGPGVTPLYPPAGALTLDVETPAGRVLPIDDPALADELADAAPVHLLRSDRAMTDCRPVSLISRATIAQLAGAADLPPEPRRVRPNILLDLDDPAGFAEDELVGRCIRIGPRLRLAVTGRDPRCRMIGIDPDTAELASGLLRHVARDHAGAAGVYAAVLVEGMIRPHDPILLEEPPR